MNAAFDVTTIELETPRMILRPWKIEDLDDFYSYAKVEGVGEMAGWSHHKSKEESEKILYMFIREKKTFAMELKKNRQVIGSIGVELIRVKLGDEYQSLKGRELGYVLSKDYWGQGLMKEGVKAVIHFLFTELHHDFLVCSHEKGNLQSKSVIKACGFTPLSQSDETTRLGPRTFENYMVMNPEK